MIPKYINESHNNTFPCEIINATGSYFGYIYINYAFLLFIRDKDKDPRKDGMLKEYTNIKEEEFYLYSFFLDERIMDKNKYIIIFSNEIKEIVIRRFCYNYIGYEIFLKNNKSYLFNFFNKDNINKFIQCLIVKLEDNKPINERYNNIMSQTLKSVISVKICHVNITEEINFDISNDTVAYFEEKDFRNKYYKGELSNFKYLLLLNKYSLRSYNDLYQYLIFPLLFMDTSRKKERDLSKALALNKPPEKIQAVLEHLQENYKTFGCYFNSNYSTLGFVLYYLVRMNPITYGHIKFQSYQFDTPTRMFNTFSNHLQVIISTEENRELIPEFFHSYEVFLNLNYINLGCIIKEGILINDFDTSEKNGIAEFIINMRQELEKTNILPWVDNIFGCNQIIKNNSSNNEIYNIFPSSAYEKDYEKMKATLKKQGKNPSEIINAIKTEINVLNFGMIPKQLFKSSSKAKKVSKDMSIKKEVNSKQNNKKSLDYNIIKDINSFLKLNLDEKSKIFLLDNNNVQKLIIKSKKTLHFLPLFNNSENKNTIIKRELRTKNRVKFIPLSKMICELSNDIFLSCGYIDKIIKINFSDKKEFLVYYDNIITSVEYYSHKEKEIAKNVIRHSNKVIFGDEMGYLNLMKIKYKIINKKEKKINRLIKI